MRNPAPSETFRAYIYFANDEPPKTWEGLTWTKAHWRYHWIKRQFYKGIFRDVKTYGFQSEQFSR